MLTSARSRLVASVAVCAGVAWGCGEEASNSKPAARSARADTTASIGHPVTPQTVKIPRRGTIELVAAGRRRPRSPAFRLVVLSTSNPRDLCVATGLVGDHVGESNETCGVRARGRSSVSAMAPGVPDRLGLAPTVIAGIAPPDVRRVELHVAGGWHATLPLSKHRAFLALVRPRFRGRVWVISETTSGRVSTRRFKLPIPLIQKHPVRRRGVVFNDEVGENIMLLSYDQVVRRFGPPARERTEDGQRCAYYEVVGQGRGWRFCFDAGGRMDGASGNNRLP